MARLRFWLVLAFVVVFSTVSRESFAVNGAWWSIGSFPEGATDLGAAQAGAEASWDDFHGMGAGACPGNWIVTNADGFGDHTIKYHTDSTPGCPFGNSDVTWVTRVDCPGAEEAQLLGPGANGYGQAYTCGDACDWPNTFDQITQQCELYDDCSPGEVPDPANPFQCIPDDCSPGDFESVAYGLYWAANPSDISVTIPEPICIAACEYNISSSDIIEAYPGTGCGQFGGEQVCSGSPSGFTIAIGATGTGDACAGETPAPPCSTCSGPPSPVSDPQAPQESPAVNPPQSDPTPNGGPAATTTNTDNGDGTTTQTTTKTYPDGSTTTTSTTTTTATGDTSTTVTSTDGQAEENDEGNERLYSGGGCGAAPFCSGDAIDCAVARQTWETKCALDTEGVDVDVASLESELGESDIETVVAGIEETPVDASDPLTLGGYIEASAPGCPADYSIAVLGSTFPITWSWVCMLMLAVRPVVMAAGLFLATLIFYRGVVREG